MDRDELLDWWAERVLCDERVELPWKTMRSTVFKAAPPRKVAR